MQPHNNKLCTKCILPDSFPGINFDVAGVCNFCRSAPPPQDLAKIRGKLTAQMVEAIEAAKATSPENYDCVVAFSGGKDSSYTLSLLVTEYKLKCLAITIDNGFVADQAIANCKAVTTALGVDFMFFTPAPTFMNNMYKASALQSEEIHSKSALTRASSICNSCISLINTYMIKVSLQQRIPLIAGGYIGGQVPKDGAVMQIDLDMQQRLSQSKLEKFSKAFGPRTNDYFAIPERYMKDKIKITLLNPMLTLAVTEDQIIERISQFGWKKTTNTGAHSTNCRLNDLGIALHLKQNGFHPYAAEVSDQIRAGTMTRETALKKVGENPQFADLVWQANKIGIGNAA